MMMMISNLPNELVEEILARIPLRSLKAVRSTCKKWNALTKNRSFTDKHIDKTTASDEKQFLMVKYSKAYLIGVNLHGTANHVDLSIEGKGKLMTLDNSDEIFSRSNIFHCNGLILCEFETRLVVWNPYCRIPKCIRRRSKFGISAFALGYNQACGQHKILRLYGNYLNHLEIYDFNTDSWRVPSVTLELDILYFKHWASLKGNNYWYASDRKSTDNYLLSFDFTKERFGPCLPLPFGGHNVSLSVVKEERLAVLFKRCDIFEIEIWVTNKIEPDAVLWSYFLKVDMKPCFKTCVASFLDFFIDEDKKVAVLFDIDNLKSVTYIIGENDYFRKVDLGEPLGTNWRPLDCSYVPSSLQIN